MGDLCLLPPSPIVLRKKDVGDQDPSTKENHGMDPNFMDLESIEEDILDSVISVSSIVDNLDIQLKCNECDHCLSCGQTSTISPYPLCICSSSSSGQKDCPLSKDEADSTTDSRSTVAKKKMMKKKNPAPKKRHAARSRKALIPSNERKGRKRLPKYVVQASNGTEKYGIKLKLCGRNVRIGSNYIDPESASIVANTAKRLIRKCDDGTFFVEENIDQMMGEVCYVYMNNVIVKRPVLNVLHDFVKVSNAKYAWKYLKKPARVEDVPSKKDAKLMRKRKRRECELLRRKEAASSVETIRCDITTVKELLRLIMEDARVPASSKPLIKECGGHVDNLLKASQVFEISSLA